jgi:hypothetical protein
VTGQSRLLDELRKSVKSWEVKDANAKHKSASTSDAVEILHRRYYQGRPKRIADLSKARAEAETEWGGVIDRRSREMSEGKVTCRPVEQVVSEIRGKLVKK